MDRLTCDQYLECLAALAAPAAERVRPRPGMGGAPFDLIG
jgi:hypothetical protein